MANQAQDTDSEAAAAKETEEAKSSDGPAPSVDSVPEAAGNEEAAAAEPEAEQGQQEEPKADVEVPPEEPIKDVEVPPLSGDPIHDDEKIAPKEGEEAAESHPDPETEPAAAVAEEQVAEAEAKDEEALGNQRELRRRGRIGRSSTAGRDGDEGEGDATE